MKNDLISVRSATLNSWILVEREAIKMQKMHVVVPIFFLFFRAAHTRWSESLKGPWLRFFSGWTCFSRRSSSLWLWEFPRCALLTMTQNVCLWRSRTRLKFSGLLGFSEQTYPNITVDNWDLNRILGDVRCAASVDALPCVGGISRTTFTGWCHVFSICLG